MFLSRRSEGIYHVWCVDELGKKHKVSISSTRKTEALKFLQKFRQSEHEQRTGAKENCYLSLQPSLCATLQRNYSRRSFPFCMRTLVQFRGVLGDIVLASIMARHVDLHKIDRMKKVSAVSVNIELRMLRVAVYTALRWNLIETKPISKLQFVRVPD